MEKFALSDAHLVGDDLLDAQHRVILGYMAKIYDHLLAGKKEKDMFGLVERLDTYCRLHFLDEEKVMEDMEFPEIVAHKAQHALFITHLENFAGRFEEQTSTKNIDELLFLKNWFVEHIADLDKKYAEHKKQLEKRH